GGAVGATGPHAAKRPTAVRAVAFSMRAMNRPATGSRQAPSPRALISPFRPRPRAPECRTRMKLTTWNVNGLRARLTHVVDFLREHRPDVLCLQETKVQDEAFPREPLEDEGYNVLRCA